MVLTLTIPPPNPRTPMNPCEPMAEPRHADPVYAQAVKELVCPKCRETRQVEVTQYLLRITAFCNTCAHAWKLG